MRFKTLLPVLLLVTIVALHVVLPYKVPILFFYILPVVAAAADGGFVPALAYAMLSTLIVGAVYGLDPASFPAGRSPVESLSTLLTWSVSLVISGSLVAWLASELRRALVAPIAAPSDKTAVLPAKPAAAPVRSATEEANKVLGLLFQGQGMLDLAFEKYKLLPVDEEFKDLLYNLALDYERKAQWPMAIAVFDHIGRADPAYKDIEQRTAALKQRSLKVGVTLPSKLGRYEIERELGRGAMGIVYQGNDPKINRKVALKTMKVAGDLDPEKRKEATERFFREAESAGTLSHPSIVRIFDAGEEQDICFIAMELLDGHDLSRYNRSESLLPLPQLLEIVARVADSLDYAHSQGIIHRDIKPANIMLLKDGTVRVADFGIARITSTSRTETGVVMGTLAYMSPEQINGRKVDGRSDIFSLGVVLFELSTGRKPFDAGDELANVLFRISHDPEPEPLSINPDIPESLSAIIHRALKKNPEERFSRGAEMAQALRTAASAMGQAQDAFKLRLKDKVARIAQATPSWIAKGGSAQYLQFQVAEFKKRLQAGERRQAEAIMDEVLALLARDPLTADLPG